MFRPMIHTFVMVTIAICALVPAAASQRPRNPNDALSAWIANNGIRFASDKPASLRRMLTLIRGRLGTVSVLGLGEALHGGEEILAFRNRLLIELVRNHGFTAIALEGFDPAFELDPVLEERGDPYRSRVDSNTAAGLGHLSAYGEMIDWIRDHNRSVVS